MDGFFITAREPDTDFIWDKLEGAEAVLFGGDQPLAMFKYACHKAGIDYDEISAINPGGPVDTDKVLRAGQGEYVQQQGLFPQQLEADGVSHVVAQVGPIIGANGFSSLTTKPEWLETDMAEAFMRAYVKTGDYMNGTPAAEIVRAETSYFPDVDEAALASCIATYQKLGCWSRHVEITQAAFGATMDIFEYNSLINQRFAYEQICAVPPRG